LNNEPVAWHYPNGTPEQCTTNKEYAEMEPAWTPMYYHPAKTLTDEEIKDFTVRIYNCRTGAEAHEIVLAILRKAQEK